MVLFFRFFCIKEISGADGTTCGATCCGPCGATCGYVPCCATCCDVPCGATCCGPCGATCCATCGATCCGPCCDSFESITISPLSSIEYKVVFIILPSTS